MRALGPALVLLTALAACTGDSARLEGTWKGVKAEGVSAEQQSAANTFASAMAIEVKGDTITVKTPKEAQSGKFKVVSSDKATIVITTDRDGPDDKQTFAFIDDKTMKWTVMEGKTITFAKE